MIQSGESAKVIDAAGHITEQHTPASKLAISAREVTAMSSPNFGLVAVTIENPTQHWLRIARLRIDFSKPELNDQVIVTGGDDLTAWAQATITRNEIRQVNSQTALAVIGIASALMLSVTRNQTAKTAGAVGTAAALGSLTVSAINTRTQNAETRYAFGGGHLLDVPIAVPPGLFTKRFIVLNTPEGTRSCIGGFMLDYDLDSGERERVWLDLRGSRMGSEWQADSCKALVTWSGTYN